MRYAIITSGHSGSTWLMTVLHRPKQGIAAFHEPITQIVGPLLYSAECCGMRPSELSDAWVREAFAPYVEWAGCREKQFVRVGEIHTALGSWWCRVGEILPARRVLVVRHGIQVVHSISQGMLTTDPLVWNPGKRPQDAIALPSDCEDLPPEDRAFAGVCARWSEQAELVDRLGPMDVFRLEDLTKDPGALEAFLVEYTGVVPASGECSGLQARVVNRKVFGDRSPENLFWNLWSSSKREIFRRLCTAALDRFGYRIPPKSAAPRIPDLHPARPKHQPENVPGPFAPVWVFSSNPLDSPVLVYGSDERALLAAELLVKLGKRDTYLIHDLRQTWRDCPEGFRTIPIEQASEIEPGGVFIADASPTSVQLEMLRELFSNGEIVKMLPVEMTAEQRQRRWESIGSGVVELLRFGPFRVGESISSGWRVATMQANRDGLRLCLRSGTEGALNVDVKSDLGGHPSPFPVAEGGIHYGSTSLDFSRVRPLCTVVARRFQEGLIGESVAETLARWLEGSDAEA